MAKLLTIGKTNVDNSGILYVLVVRLDCGTEVYKVGVTKRKIEERVMESILKLYSNLSIEGKDYIKVRLEMIGELDVSK